MKAFCITIFMTSIFNHGNKDLLVVTDSINSSNKYGNYLKIIIIKSGSGIININEDNKVFTAQEIFCFNQNDRVYLSKIKDLEIIVIYFDPSIINEKFNLDNIIYGLDFAETATLLDRDSLRPFISREGNYCGILSPGPVAFVRLLQLAESTLTYIHNETDRFRLCRIRSYFLELILLLSEMYYRRTNLNIEVDVIDYDNEIYDVILYLLSNYHNKITVNDLTKKFNTNRNNLREKFIKVTGVPVITYLIKLRIKIASILLKDTSLNIAEIMEHVGFENISHFGRMFRKHTGLSPSKFRRL